MPVKKKIRKRKQQIVVTIHGIRWTVASDWQNRLATYIDTHYPRCIVLNFRYGRLLALTSWWMSLTSSLKIPSWARSRYLNKFTNFIRDLQKQFPNAEISVVAHSFGGWLTEQALVKDRTLKLNRVIFIHCPISEYIEETLFWNWLEIKRLKYVYSWSSHNDEVIGKVAVAPFGKNGHFGFIRKLYRRDLLRPVTQPYPVKLFNRPTKEKHSGVLNKEKYYLEIFDQLFKDVK